MNNAPYVHTFKTSEQCYVYDVNTDKILKVPQAVYDYLSAPENINVDDETISFIQNMKENGFLRSDRVEVSEHPATPMLPFYMKNKMHQLILQVTQNCNLRCTYCTYSGLYKNRKHSHNSMSVETAERAIDFFIKRTKDSRRVTISFYGGEPLLNLDLIKHCINYIETRYYGKNINFGMTTNGTLLNKDAIKFLVDKKFNIMISLDGSEKIHDARRRFASDGNGTFSTIINNIANIKKYYRDFYQTNVTFITVLDTTKDFISIGEFISNNDTLEENKFLLNYISDNYTEQKIEVNDEFYIEREYEFFKFLLSKLGEISHQKTFKLMAYRLADIYHRCFQSFEIEQEYIPKKFHHSGPCIPGTTRLFVDINGNFFPCERVSEQSKTVVLGNIQDGIVIEKITQVLNPEIITHSKCKNCWAYRKCYACVALADDMQGISKDITSKRCPIICDSIDNKFKDYCVLRELGYTFDEEIMRGDL